MPVIKVNEKEVAWEEGMTLHALRQRLKPDADIVVYNGFPVADDRAVQPDDRICLIRRGEVPNAEEMKQLLVARHSPQVHEKIQICTVGIAGAGGLGSAVAIALARLSVGKLVVADFDVVEPSNLNRQQYFIDQIGLPKVLALKANLLRINPYVAIETHQIKVDKTNISSLFGSSQVIAECYDNPEAKSELTEYVLSKMDIPLVAVSGIAGYRDMDKLVCRCRLSKLFLIGDGTSAARPGQGLMAPKVGIAAHMQANKILELLLSR
jgi:sulfur carrier protein ThiS adenylyltransferase